jgi:AraC-like DNA-binding protein
LIDSVCTGLSTYGMLGRKVGSCILCQRLDVTEINTSQAELTMTRYPADTFMPRHSHETAKVSIMLSGSVLETSQRGERFCRAGEIVSKPSGHEHSDRVGKHGLCTLSIHYFGSNQAWNELVDDYAWLPIDPVVARFISGYLRKSYLEQEVIEECVHCLAANRAQAKIARQASDHWSNQAVEILRATFRRPPSLCSLAGQIGAHPVSLATALKQRTGKTKTELVHRFRVQHALRLLRKGDLPSDIAHELGFSDQAHFNRVFKYWMGCAPTEYRRAFCALH